MFFHLSHSPYLFSRHAIADISGTFTCVFWNYNVVLHWEKFQEGDIILIVKYRFKTIENSDRIEFAINHPYDEARVRKLSGISNTRFLIIRTFSKKFLRQKL
jgi:hypothetical protein